MGGEYGRELSFGHGWLGVDSYTAAFFTSPNSNLVLCSVDLHPAPTPVTCSPASGQLPSISLSLSTISCSIPNCFTISLETLPPLLRRALHSTISTPTIQFYLPDRVTRDGTLNDSDNTPSLPLSHRYGPLGSNPISPRLITITDMAFVSDVPRLQPDGHELQPTPHHLAGQMRP